MDTSQSHLTVAALAERPIATVDAVLKPLMRTTTCKFVVAAHVSQRFAARILPLDTVDVQIMAFFDQLKILSIGKTLRRIDFHLLSALILVNAFSGSALAQVEPKIHKLCIEAKDYAGCVRAMKGESTSPPASSRVINSQGADIAEGNQCPAGYAYLGGGNCQYVSCEYNSAGFNALGHDQLIAGKKDSAGKDIWGCKFSFWHGSGVLRLSGAVTRASNNPQCPAGEPTIGFNSTCQTAPKNWLAK